MHSTLFFPGCDTRSKKKQCAIVQLTDVDYSFYKAYKLYPQFLHGTPKFSSSKKAVGTLLT